uniref:beta-glucosidase n=1 Tax=Phytophthora ramorum TaxID=164328 RepID=H3GER9_PHYRM
MASVVAQTTAAERTKIVRKLMVFVRSKRKIDFAAVGRSCQPVRSGKTVKKIHDKFLRGEVWDQVGPRVIPEHQPLRVNRQLHDLLKTKPSLTKRQQAEQLGIKASTFSEITCKIKRIPPSEIVFSYGNAEFGTRFKRTLALAQDTIKELSIGGILLSKAETGKISLLLDRGQLLAPYEMPLVEKLLDASIDIFVQERDYKVTHQKTFIVDNICAITGSANPTKNGMELSSESLTYHSQPDQIDRCILQHEQETREAIKIDKAWLAAEYARVVQSKAGTKRQSFTSLLTDGTACTVCKQLFEPQVKPNGALYKTCTKCPRARESSKARYEKAKAEKRCHRCHGNLAKKASGEAYTLCEPCRIKINESMKSRYIAEKEKVKSTAFCLADIANGVNRISFQNPFKNGLLQNNDSVLPIPETSTVFLTGHSADNVGYQCGGWSLSQQGYSGNGMFPNGISVKDGFQAIANETVTYFNGLNYTGTYNESDLAQAKELASKAEYTIAVIGEHSYTEKTYGDINDLDLPAGQIEYVKELASTGTKVIVVLVGGRPRLLGELPSTVHAVVNAMLPCELGGQALAEIVYGRVNPSGRMPITYPKDAGNILMPYNHRVSTQCASGAYCEMQWEFGHGLSYTNFTYSDMTISRSNVTSITETIDVSVVVTNSGSVDGKETVMLFLTQPFRTISVPEVKQLKKFTKVDLKAGDSTTVNFTLSADDWSVYYPQIGSGLKKVAEDADYVIAIKPETDCDVYNETAVANPLCATFTLETGEHPYGSFE